MNDQDRIMEALPELLEMEEAIGFIETLGTQWGVEDAGAIIGNVTNMLGVRDGDESMADFFINLWDLIADREAIVTGDKRFTFAAFKERTFRLANALQGLGVRPKDRVAEILPNSNEFFELFFACSFIGTPMPFVNWHIREHELIETIKRRSPTAVVFDAEFTENVLAIRDALPEVKHWIVAGGPVPDGMLSYETLIEESSAEKPDMHFILALNPYTGGTTGTPKSSNFYDGFGYTMSDYTEAPRVAVDEYLKYLIKGISFLHWFGGSTIKDAQSGNIRALIPTPLYHAGTIVAWAPFMLLGGTVVPMRKFDAEEFLRLIEKERINWAFVAPTILQRVLALPDDVKRAYNLSTMRSLICAAAPCPVAVKKDINALFMAQGAPGPVFSEYYGTSETSVITVLLPQDYAEHEERYASVGKARCGDLRTYNEEREAWCPPNEEGRILSRTCTTVSLRYPGSEDKLPESIRRVDGNEWFDDGLLGTVDDDGFLYLTSRVKEMIISGGVNIYPTEIETVILSHPAVFDVAVIRVPDDGLGEAPGAIIQLTNGSAVTADDIVTHCKNNGLFGYKVPRVIDFVEILPRHIDGKVLKRELEGPYWQGIERRG